MWLAEVVDLSPTWFIEVGDLFFLFFLFLFCLDFWLLVTVLSLEAGEGGGEDFVDEETSTGFPWIKVLKWEALREFRIFEMVPNQTDSPTFNPRCTKWPSKGHQRFWRKGKHKNLLVKGFLGWYRWEIFPWRYYAQVLPLRDRSSM